MFKLDLKDCTPEELIKSRSVFRGSRISDLFVIIEI